MDTSHKNFQNRQNHLVVVFSGSTDLEISADFSRLSSFTAFLDVLLTVIVATGVGLGAFVTAGEALMEIIFPLRLYL